MEQRCIVLLEYTVEFVIDPETGETKRHYYPQRTSAAPLDIDILIVEEGTLVGVGPGSLWAELYDALPPHCQVIMLGDINQLPPVIGKSVLSYAIQSPDFNIVELNHIHRQALDNPIIRQAHNVLAGKPLESDTISTPTSIQGVNLFTGKYKYKLLWQQFNNNFMQVINFYWEKGIYDPTRDMILCPYNKMSSGKKKDDGVSREPDFCGLLSCAFAYPRG